MSGDWTQDEIRRALDEHTGIPFHLGRVVLIWTHIESQSFIALLTIVGLPTQESRILLNGLAIETVWDHSVQLLKHRGESELADWLSDWIARARPLRERRNTAVHGWWLTTGEPEVPFRVLDFSSRKARAELREDLVPGGSAELRALADEMDSLSSEHLTWAKGPLVDACQPYKRRGSKDPPLEGSVGLEGES